MPPVTLNSLSTCKLELGHACSGMTLKSALQAQYGQQEDDDPHRGGRVMLQRMAEEAGVTLPHQQPYPLPIRTEPPNR